MSSSFEIMELGWRNLLSTGNQFTILTFDESNPFTLVIGNSGDGKTTMMDALSLCWYGKALRPITKPALINSINGKECEVYCVFRKFSHFYKITRGIKPNTLKVEKDGVEIDMPAGSEPQDIIDEIVGVSYKVAKHVVLVSAASYTPFMQMTAKERREVVEELRELHIFTEMQKLAKLEADSTNKELSSVTNEVNVLNGKRTLLERFIQESTAVHTERITQVKEKIENLTNEISTLTSEQESLISEGKTKKTLLVGYDEERQKRTDCNTSRIRLEERNRTYKNSADIGSIEKCPTCHQLVSDDHKHDIASKASVAIQKNLDKIEQIDSMLSDIAPKIKVFEEVEKDLQTLRSAVSLNKSKIEMNESSLKSLRNELTKLETPQESTETHIKELLEVNQGVDKGNAQESLLRAKISTIQECQKHLKDDGIKASLVEEFIPTFNALVNQQLDRMGFFVQFELDRDFNETIKSRHRDVFTYYSFSEGEKQRIDLALLFAWRELSSMSGLVLPNILILDEIFGSSLDAETVDRVVDILNDMKEQMNVVCITHHADIPPIFNRTLKFTKQKNYSVMTEINGE